MIGHAPRISEAFELKWSYKLSDLNECLNATTFFGGGGGRVNFHM